MTDAVRRGTGRDRLRELLDAVLDDLRARLSATRFLPDSPRRPASGMTSDYLRELFDSWAGALSRADYVRHVQPHSAAALAVLEGLDVPKIHFGVGTGELLAQMSEVGCDVIGVDYRVSIPDALERTGSRLPVQGNLDPALLFAPWEPLASRVRAILTEGAAAPGHIFNLGHGVLPSTDPDVLTRVVDLVHEHSRR